MVSPIVRLRTESLGDQGRRWLKDLPAVVAELEACWRVTLDRSLAGGTAAFVAFGRTAGGVRVVLKVGVPDPAHRDEIGMLERAAGRGYVRLLAHDAAHGAMLLEALGTSLSASGLSPPEQLVIIGELAVAAWTVPRPAAGPAAAPVDKAAELRDLVDRLWRKLGPDCPARVRDEAIAGANRRSEAFNPAACVMLHGDAAAANVLRVPVPRPGAETGFVFIDPDGFVGDPGYDLGVALRDWCPELKTSEDPRALMASYAAVLTAATGIEGAAIQDWAYLERVSSGLHALNLGAAHLARPLLETAAELV